MFKVAKHFQSFLFFAQAIPKLSNFIRLIQKSRKDLLFLHSFIEQLFSSLDAVNAKRLYNITNFLHQALEYLDKKESTSHILRSIFSTFFSVRFYLVENNVYREKKCERQLGDLLLFKSA